MSIDWGTVFDNFGFKVVTSTDIEKSAYVVTEAQRAALTAAGKDPGDRSIFDIDVLFDPSVRSLEVSYYNSVRSGSGRTPEPRIGKGLIKWAGIGDHIVLADRSGRAIAAHSSKIEGSANNFSSRGLCDTGRSSTDTNSDQADASSMNSRDRRAPRGHEPTSPSPRSWSDRSPPLRRHDE